MTIAQRMPGSYLWTSRGPLVSWPKRMERFDDERPELTGSLISMEFGPGGRINQLWASDPALPDEGEDFQFVLPPVPFGEETSDDFSPGTILLGVRTDPEGPWIVSRNTRARQPEQDDQQPFDANSVEFEYDFPLIDDLAVTGRFYEVGSLLPQIVWDLKIENKGRRAIEIGELGFPLAFNNLYDGFGWSDEQLQRLWNSRIYIHKFIGGGASWLFVQRMTAATPGLLVFPGDETSWEFYNHVQASLNTPYQWEGIPIVYAYSKATIERERVDGWSNEHTSLILEPGDSRRVQMRFVPCESDKQEGVHQTLVACERPSIRLLPGAVAPCDVGIAIEVSGASPEEFLFSRETDSEVDADEQGGFCFVRPSTPGPLRVSFMDANGRPCHTHLLFTDPIERLIQRRAEYICENQVEDSHEVLHDAILLTNIATGERVTDPEDYEESAGIECSLGDALFLAEKNTVFPLRSQIAVLDAYIAHFLLERVQNPGDHSVASVLQDEAVVGGYFGRPLCYPHVMNLYHSMYRIASTYGETEQKPQAYLSRAYETAQAMFRFGWRHYVRTVGVLGYARIYGLIDDLRKEGMGAEADALLGSVSTKAAELTDNEYPYAGESVLDTSGLEEVFAAAKFLDDDAHLERTVRCAFATRSLAPSWWWYGSDKRNWDGADSTPTRAMADRGETCLAHTTIPNSLIFFGLMDRDYLAIPEAYMRMAFGGMLGPWALVRTDGAAAMCYCPDLSSKHAGFNAYTGSSGHGLFHYLREVSSYVLPNQKMGLYTFGCHFESLDDSYSVRPWEGVGRRIVMRQIGAEFSTNFGRFIELRLDKHKRWFEAEIQNPSDKDVRAELTVTGMWGTSVTVQGKAVATEGGRATTQVALPARQTVRVRGNVQS